jgi:transposase
VLAFWGGGVHDGGVARDYLSGDRSQPFLLPPDMREWLPADHLVWFVIDVMGRLDLSAFEQRSGDLRGRRAYDPAVVATVLVYAYCVGERSSRRIERRCHEDVAFRVAAANLAPDHTTLSRFITDRADAFDGLFVQVLSVAAAAGMVRVGAIYLDGTKIAADASPLAGRTRAQLEAEVRRITDEARTIDEREDDEFGDGTGEELPADLVDPDRRRAALDEALRQLEDVEARRRSTSKSRKPPRVNLTDPEARTMKGPRGWLWAFNAQAAVSDDGVIVAADVTQSPVDNSQFVPLVDQALDNLADVGAQMPDHAVADAGYWSSVNATSHHAPDAPRSRPTPLIPPVPSASRPTLATRGPAPASATPMQIMERKLRQRTPRRLYQRRKSIVEPTFGMIKAARGINRFRRHGLDAARHEWRLTATTHNLLKIWRHQPATA